MPPLRTSKFIAHSTNAGHGLQQLALNYGGSYARRHVRPQPYSTRIKQPRILHTLLAILNELMEKANLVENAAVSKTTRSKDASRLNEFLLFCEGLGIKNHDALPASEDLLAAWASSYTGRYAGKTVGAKISAIRKEHERQRLPWSGGERLRRIINIAS